MGTGKSIYVGGILLSILLSLALYLSGRRETAISSGYGLQPSSTWVRASEKRRARAGREYRSLMSIVG